MSVDHAAEALRCIDYSWSPDAVANRSQIGAMVEAQVHATLALVEQQRIANLIALAHHVGFGLGEVEQIRKGLGL
jgi:hypothetical protein